MLTGFHGCLAKTELKDSKWSPRVTPVAPRFQSGKEPGKAWAFMVAAPHTAWKNPRGRGLLTSGGMGFFSSPLFKIPQRWNKERLEGGMPQTNCRVGLFCLWSWSLKLKLSLFYFCLIGKGLTQGRSGEWLLAHNFQLKFTQF